MSIIFNYLLKTVNILPVLLSMVYLIGTVGYSSRYFSIFFLIVLPLISIICDILYIKIKRMEMWLKIFFITNSILFIFWLVMSTIFSSMIVNNFDKMSFWLKIYVILDLDRLIHNF